MDGVTQTRDYEPGAHRPFSGSVMANFARVSEKLVCLTVIHPCEHRGHEPTVVTRPSSMLYVRCETCAETWSVPKPGVPPLVGT